MTQSSTRNPAARFTMGSLHVSIDAQARVVVLPNRPGHSGPESRGGRSGSVGQPRFGGRPQN